MKLTTHTTLMPPCEICRQRLQDPFFGIGACRPCAQYFADLYCEDIIGGLEYRDHLRSTARVQSEIRRAGGTSQWLAEERLKHDLACPCEDALERMREERDQLVQTTVRYLTLVGGPLLPGRGKQGPRGAAPNHGAGALS